MGGARAAVVRGGLLLLTGVCAVLGGVIFVWPETFFGWSWVNMGMAYNPHLLLDYGAMNLAVAVVLGGAAVTMSRTFVRTTLAGYGVWSVAHFLIHLEYRSHFVAHASVAEANVLVTTLGVGAVIPIVLLILTFGAPPSRACGQETPGGSPPRQPTS